MMEKYSNKIGRIPNDWDFVNAKDCISLESGMRPKEYVTDVETDIPSLGGENIDDKGFLVFDNIRYISPSYYKKMKKGQIQDNDIFINKDGANTGKVAYSKIKPFPECAVNEHVFLIRNNGTFVQQYLFYCLLANFGKQQILKKVIGSAQEGINNSFTKGIILPKPSLPEQTAIAAILSKVDEAIAAVQASISAAERLKKSLMQNLLTGRMKPDGTLRKEDEFYVDEKFGKIPVGWDVKKVKDLSIQVTDGEHQTPERAENGYYLLSARNIKNGYLSLDDVDFIPEKELRRIQKRCNPQGGDILISCSGTIGNVCIVPDGFVGGMVRSAALVKLNKDKIESQFAELMFQSHFLQNQMKVAVASSVQGNIFQGAIRDLRMFYPQNKQERLEIVNKINQFNKIITDNVYKIAVLERLKKSLMQNMLTGKTRLNKF